MVWRLDITSKWRLWFWGHKVKVKIKMISIEKNGLGSTTSKRFVKQQNWFLLMIWDLLEWLNYFLISTGNCPRYFCYFFMYMNSFSAIDNWTCFCYVFHVCFSATDNRTRYFYVFQWWFLYHWQLNLLFLMYFMYHFCHWCSKVCVLSRSVLKSVSCHVMFSSLYHVTLCSQVCVMSRRVLNNM